MPKIAKLRNINTNLSKSDIIYVLIPSEPVINEEKYIIDSNNEIHSKINDIRVQHSKLLPHMNKKGKGKIRKRLYDIKKTTKIDRKTKQSC